MSGRRNNNEGTLRKRSDGRWEAIVSLPNGDRKSYYGKTKGEALKKLNQIKRDIEQGKMPADEKQTLSQYFDFWQEKIHHEVEESTYRLYGFHIKRLKKSLGDRILAKLTAQDLQQLYAQLLGLGLAPTTVHVMHGIIKHALSDAVDLEILQRNVAIKVKPPRYEPEVKGVWSEEQVRQFLQTVKGHRYEAMFILALSTGMRLGELITLQWQDIDFSQRTLLVRSNLQLTNKGYRVHHPKTPSSRRTLILNAVVFEALLHHQQQQEEEKKLLGNEWSTAYDFVFATDTGHYLDPSSFTARIFGRLVRLAQVPEIDFHSLRHTCATLLLSKGVNVKAVSEMLGHSDISITLRIYGHVLPRMHQNAALVMESIIIPQKDT